MSKPQIPLEGGDFNWQGEYQLETLIQEILCILTCTWNNTSGDPDDARYITWGEGTNDEMCLNVVTIKPAEGFATVPPGELFISSLGIYPSWLPFSFRIGLMRSPSLVIGGLVLAVITILALGALVVYKLKSHRNSVTCHPL